MKALSFRQPWAELILQGRKTMDCSRSGTRRLEGSGPGRWERRLQAGRMG